MPRDVRRYRGVIVGLGNVARRGHLPGFRRAPRPADRIEIVGAVDPALDGATVDGLRVVSRMDDIAGAFGSVDFVDLCAPSAAHVSLTLEALERGYHVICEKPVAIRRADATRVAAAAARAGRVVMPCHQYRFNPAWQQLRRWLDARAIGDWTLAEFHVYRQQADLATGSDGLPWRARRREGLGGVLVDHGTHLCYQILDVAGPPLAVNAWIATARHREYQVEDTAQLLLTYPDRLAVVFLTWAARHRETRIRFVGTEGTISWEDGLLRLALPSGGESLDFSAALDKASYAHWFSDLFETFVAALDRGEGSDFLRDIEQVAALLDEAYGQARPRATRRPARAG